MSKILVRESLFIDSLLNLEENNIVSLLDINFLNLTQTNTLFKLERGNYLLIKKAFLVDLSIDPISNEPNYIYQINEFNHFYIIDFRAINILGYSFLKANFNNDVQISEFLLSDILEVPEYLFFSEFGSRLFVAQGIISNPTDLQESAIGAEDWLKGFILLKSNVMLSLTDCCFIHFEMKKKRVSQKSLYFSLSFPDIYLLIFS